MPFRKVGITHGPCLVRVPVAECFLVTTDGQAVLAVDAWSISLDHQSFFVAFGDCASFAVRQQCFGKCRTVEVLLLRKILPAVVDAQAFLNVGRQIDASRKGVPFGTDGLTVTVYVITVFDNPFGRQLNGYFIAPMNAVYCGKGYSLLRIIFPKFGDRT